MIANETHTHSHRKAHNIYGTDGKEPLIME
jgi:hypothetical protein